jgi:hypothetical protein
MTADILDEKSYTEVRFALPYRLPFEGTFEFEDSDVLYSVNLEHVQIYDRRSEEVLRMTFGSSGSGSTTLFDQHGLSHVSTIIVKFNKEATSDEAKEMACRGLNRVVDAYREVTRDYRITRVKSQHDVVSFSVSRVETGGGGSLQLQFGQESKFVYPIRIRTFEESKEEIQARLKSGFRIPLWSEYRHEARKDFDERRFALSVVLMNSAMELAWAEILREGLLQQGDDPLKARTKMRNWLSAKNTLKTLDKALQEVFGISLREAEPTLWQNLEKARRLRKNVLHPWAKTPGLEETYESMVSMEIVFRWFSDNLLPRLTVDPVASKLIRDELYLLKRFRICCRRDMPWPSNLGRPRQRGIDLTHLRRFQI